jgi:glycosyltransferase 2 family protein
LNNRLKDIIKYLLFSSIGALFLYLAFRQTEWSQLIDDLKQADYKYVLISMLMGYAAFISRGMRWNLLLEPLGKRANTWNAINAVSIGYFANAAVPRAGEVMRCTSLRSTDEIPLERLFGTVVLERVIDGFMLLSLIALTIILKFSTFVTFFEEAFAQGPEEVEQGFPWKFLIIGGFLLFVLMVFLLREKVQSLPFFSKIRELWQGFKEGFVSLAKVKNKWAFIAHTLFIWANYFLMIYVVTFSLPATSEISLSNGLFVMIAGGMGMVVPSPGGIGSYHYLVMLALSVLGIDKADGLSFATIVHGSQFFMTLIAGLIAMPFIYRARKILKSKSV